MVLAPFGPTVSVDPNGLNQQSGMLNPPVSQGGTITQALTAHTELDPAVQLQGPVPQFNPFQEVNAFIAGMCSTYNAATGLKIAPMAMWAKIRDVGNAMFAFTYHA